MEIERREITGRGVSDYRNENGLLVCGICGKPKQQRLPNPFTEDGEPSSVVPVLCDCEMLAEEEESRRKERECAKMLAEKRRTECFKRSAIFKGCTFTSSDNKSPEQERLCKEFAETFDPSDPDGLLLWGGVGTGKSFMSSCIANAVIDFGHSAFQVDMATIATIMESSFEKRLANLDRILGYDLLCIEDLGAERCTEYMTGMVYSVIDGRYKAGKPMIVTTNKMLAAMEKAAPSDPWCRIYDRLIERCYPIEFSVPRRKVGAMSMRAGMRTRLKVTNL